MNQSEVTKQDIVVDALHLAMHNISANERIIFAAIIAKAAGKVLDFQANELLRSAYNSEHASLGYNLYS